MPLSVFEFHWSEMWRWPPSSPLIDKVVQRPPILDTIPRASDDRSCAPSTGKHLLVLIEAGIFLAGVAQDDELVSSARERRYTTRQEQGSAQFYYTKRKASSYGARLREREGKALIQDACDQMTKLLASHGPFHHTWLHCDPRILGRLRKASPKLLAKLEERSSKLSNPPDVYQEDALQSAWRALTIGRFR